MRKPTQHDLPCLEQDDEDTCERCDARAGFWDDAVKGRSPLQASLRWLLADKILQHTENQEAYKVVFGVESCCDSSLCLWWHEFVWS